MNKLIAILTAGMLAIPTAFSINENTPKVEVQATILYEPDNDDPTSEFPLIVVDTPAAYKAWCLASENSDEPFFVAMPGDGVEIDVFLTNLTNQIEDTTIDSERVYLVASTADSPLLVNQSEIYTFSIVLDPPTPSQRMLSTTSFRI